MKKNTNLPATRRLLTKFKKKMSVRMLYFRQGNAKRGMYSEDEDCKNLNNQTFAHRSDQFWSPDFTSTFYRTRKSVLSEDSLKDSCFLTKLNSRLNVQLWKDPKTPCKKTQFADFKSGGLENEKVESRIVGSNRNSIS